MARLGDFQAHRREVLAHYLEAARFDRVYALSACADAEAKSEGTLTGVTEELRALAPPQTTPTKTTTGRRNHASVR
jgi:hypothetical protein